MTSKLTALSLLLCLFGAPTDAYITTGLPAHTHRAFLRKLTDDICNASPGSLSIETVNHTAPMLMSAWAEAPEKLHLSASAQFSGKERAMAVEGLLKRMIDDRRAGNAAAMVKTQNAAITNWAISAKQCSAAF